jgi:signal transduction histidine kinase
MSAQDPPEARFAHELREALGAMQMALEVLRRPSDEATRARMLELLERQLTILAKLADESAAPGARRAASAGGGRRILVVDDNVDSAEVLGALLEHMGHEVFVAYTGRARPRGRARAASRRGPPRPRACPT